ncbi:hypothetical protein PV325_010822 [Microctonus aethiopoides]|nr:hypothetical protein PV325_010822 [Microctonus aethiopoides]
MAAIATQADCFWFCIICVITLLRATVNNGKWVPLTKRKKGARVIERRIYFGNNEKIDLRDEWCQNLGINIKSELGVAVICSLHFKEDQFSFASMYDNLFFKNKRLKKRAIPTELIPKKITDVAKKSEELESLRQERREKRDNEKENVKRKLESEKVRILP